MPRRQPCWLAAVEAAVKLLLQWVARVLLADLSVRDCPGGSHAALAAVEAAVKYLLRGVAEV